MSRNTQGLVIDCSFILSILLPDEKNDFSQEILESGRYDPLVPALWMIEVCNVLVTAVRKKRISLETRDQLVQKVFALDIKIDSRQSDPTKILSLCDEYNLTAYDSVYLDLALRTGFPIATHDRELKTAAQKAGIAVIGI